MIARPSWTAELVCYKDPGLRLTRRDMASISAFGGEDPTRARYFPEDERYLLEMTPDVIHYEVAVDIS
jgi:hypothetical protein